MQHNDLGYGNRCPFGLLRSQQIKGNTPMSSPCLAVWPSLETNLHLSEDWEAQFIADPKSDHLPVGLPFSDLLGFRLTLTVACRLERPVRPGGPQCAAAHGLPASREAGSAGPVAQGAGHLAGQQRRGRKKTVEWRLFLVLPGVSL